jgi:O-methyltransferase
MQIDRIKTTVKRTLPIPLLILYEFYRNPRDMSSLMAFLARRNLSASFSQRLFIIKQLYVISRAIDCPHRQHEVISFIEAIISVPQHIEGCVVEAGSYKGGSTAKFSIAASMVNRRLVVFDSFEGIPEHNESHDKNIFGRDVSTAFSKGSYDGTLSEVKRNISRFGNLEICELIQGWFEHTMPEFSEPIVAAYLDVDLASSTHTCLKHLYPLLVPGGVLYSHDGHLPLVIEAFKNDEFWKSEVGCPMPEIEGLGRQKLLRIVKPSN